MKAVGDYAIIDVENTTSATGITVKLDGEGICVSCPSMPDIEGKRVLFNMKTKHAEHYGVVIVRAQEIMMVID